MRLFESVEARTRELAASLEDLRTTQDRLVQTQKLASLGQLTAGIAHEMKNPLNFVNNFSAVSSELIDELQDTLKDIPFGDKARADINELTDTLRDNLGKVVQHGKRADAIVENMLLHSRESSANTGLSISMLSLRKVSISPGTGRGPRSRALRSSSNNPLIRLLVKPTSSRRTSRGLF